MRGGIRGVMRGERGGFRGLIRGSRGMRGVRGGAD